MEVCLVPFTKTASQYPGLFLFTTPARMMRSLLNIAAGKPEMIGTFEQVNNNCPGMKERKDHCIMLLRQHPKVMIAKLGNIVSQNFLRSFYVFTMVNIYLFCCQPYFLSRLHNCGTIGKFRYFLGIS